MKDKIGGDIIRRVEIDLKSCGNECPYYRDDKDGWLKCDKYDELIEDIPSFGEFPKFCKLQIIHLIDEPKL